MTTHQPRHIKSNTPKFQVITWLFFSLIIAVSVLAYLAVQRWDSLAYMVTDNYVVTGVNALKNSWPIYALIGGVTALTGVFIGTLGAKTAKERSAEARALQAEQLANGAKQSAEKAHHEALAALSEKMRQAELAQQRAREHMAAANATRAAADNEITYARERVEKLEKDLARCNNRLRGARKAMENGSDKVSELETELAALRDEILP